MSVDTGFNERRRRRSSFLLVRDVVEDDENLPVSQDSEVDLANKEYIAFLKNECKEWKLLAKTLPKKLEKLKNKNEQGRQNSEPVTNITGELYDSLPEEYQQFYKALEESKQTWLQMESELLKKEDVDNAIRELNIEVRDRLTLKAAKTEKDYWELQQNVILASEDIHMDIPDFRTIYKAKSLEESLESFLVTEEK